MRFTKFVDVEVEVDIDVSFSEMCERLPTTSENSRAMLNGYSSFIGFMRNIPKELFESINERQRDLMVTAFEEQLSRLKNLKFELPPLPEEK
jgi:hypothetical protein